MRRLRAALASDRGQATVELVAVVPLLVVVGLVIAGFLAGHAAREAADQAAVSGAIAQLQGRDGVAAGRSASPAWATIRVRVKNGMVIAEVAPRLPKALAARIDGKAEVVIDPKAAAR